MGTRIAAVTGKPESAHVSTSFVERHNLIDPHGQTGGSPA